MRFEQLKEILALDHYGSLTKASQSLFIPYSTLGYSLHSLEKELGFALFKSYNGQLIPTKKGRSALELARIILNDLAAIKGVGQDGNAATGLLTIGVSPLLINTIAVDLILFMQEHFPNIQLTLVELGEWSALDHLVNHAVDFMLIGILASQQAMFSSVFQTLAINMRQLSLIGSCHVLIGQNHPLAARTSLTLADLKREEIIYYKHGYYAAQLALPLANPNNLYTDREMFKTLIYEHQAWAILPDFFALEDPLTQLGLWQNVPLNEGQEKDLAMLCYLLWPKSKVPSTLEDQVIDFIVDYFGKQQQLLEKGD